MSITQQFLFLLLFPAVFVGLAIYVARRARGRQRPMALFLALALLAAAVWGSGVLTYFGGQTMPVAVRFTWRLVSNHTLPFIALGLFLATAVYRAWPLNRRRLALGLALLLWLLSLGLDGLIWRYQLPPVLLFGQTVRHFDLWAAAWITATLFPLVTAWWLAYQATQVPASYYRNQADYWLLALSAFLLGSALAWPRELISSQLALLAMIGGALAGTAVLLRDPLPNLQLTLRLVTRRLMGALFIFAASWLTLWFVSRLLPTLSGAAQELSLLAAAALFTVLFLFTSSMSGRRLRRLARRATSESDEPVAYATLSGGALTPADVGQLTARLVQSRLACEDAWLFTVEDGVAGELVLRPLPGLAGNISPVTLPAASLLARHWRQSATPLLQYDLDYSSLFMDLSLAERALLQEWQRHLFAPLLTGQRMVGLLALGEKLAAEPYEQGDIVEAQEIAAAVAVLLAQARQTAGLSRVIDHVSEQNRLLALDQQRLRELTALYNDFLTLLSPELRRPFALIERDLQRVQEQLADGRRPSFDSLNQQIGQLQEAISNLVNMAARVQRQYDFTFQPVLLDEIVRDVQQSLNSMAQARRVRVELQVDDSEGVWAYGDSQRLTEAVHHLLHNALKFNKIGGLVRLECGASGSELFLHVLDNGVGIPQERLSNIWCGFSDLKNANVYNPKGAGMGLLLTRFIIQAHGGRVQAKSSYGRGSHFSLYLPLYLDNG